MTRVLVVDDEPQLARLRVINLKARKYDVDCAQDGGTALEAVAACRPDVVLLDLGLPDMDGIDVIKRLRVWSQVHVLVVSARHGCGRRSKPWTRVPTTTSPSLSAWTNCSPG